MASSLISIHGFVLFLILVQSVSLYKIYAADDDVSSRPAAAHAHAFVACSDQIPCGIGGRLRPTTTTTVVKNCLAHTSDTTATM